MVGPSRNGSGKKQHRSRVGISKLVGITLRNIITIKCNEGNLMWHKFHQVLTENYSDVPYVTDIMTCYLKIIQGEEESVV